MLTLFDWVTLLGYLGIILGIGAYFSRKNTSFGEYMFGNGQIPWIAVGISLIATSVSASTFLGNPADAFRTNMTYLMCNFGVFVAISIIAVVFIPRFRALNVQSAYEILEQKFSRKIRVLAACFYSCHLILRTGILIYGPAIVLAEIFGINIYGAICLTSILAIGYTYFGGLQAVIWTDVLQFVVLMIGGLLALYYCSQGIGSFAETITLAQEAGKAKWFDGTIDPSNGRTFLSAGVVYIFFELAIRGCDQQFVQRYLACKNVFEANLSSFLSAFLGLGVALLFFWVGAALFVYYRVTMVGQIPEDMNVNHVFPHFILNVLPKGVVGLLVAAILAAAMSSLDSGITALSNTAVKDLFPKAADESSKNLLGRARFWVIVWGMVGTFAAFLCVVGNQSLLSKALFFTSLFTGPLLGLFLFAFFSKNVKPNALFAGAIMGMVTLLFFSNIPILPEGWWEPIYSFSWPWNPLISLSGTTVFTLVFNLFLRD